VVAQHQQEGLVADRFSRGVNGVPKAFLVLLDDKLDALAHLQDAARILLESGRQFVVVFNRNLLVEEGLEIGQVVFLDDDDHFFDAGFDRFFHNQQDGRLGDAVAVDDREQLFFGRLGGREQARAKPGRRE
jgi:hypothetical protein